ncbi:MAG: efflux transporter outer membrane subunit [Verrucomicrobiota bacterium]
MNNFRSSIQRGAGLAVILAMLGGCAVGPNFVRPTPPDTDRYTSEARPEATTAANDQVQHFTTGAEIPADWWRLFQSTQLDAVVQQAISNNPTLQAAEASLRQSQDNLRAGYGLYFPQGQAGVSASRQLSAAPLEQTGSRTSGTVFNLFTASGTISYTLDVFGGKRRTVEGLRAQADSLRYESKAAYIALSANVVNTSIARAAYAAQIRATEQLIELEKQQLHLAETQCHAGTLAYSTVLNVRSLIAANQALLAPLEQNASQAEHLLATLEGVVPSKATLPDIELAGLSLPVDLPLSLPSELVNQRPDILSAEALMHVASANIGIATAAMFPSFSLSGTYGGASTTLANLSAVSKFWSIGPTATTPVFQGNSLWYVRRASIDAYQQSQATYRQTVLGAFAQVADCLKALEHDAEGLQAQVEAQHAAGEVLNLLQVNYRAGLVAYSDVLTADVQYHEATLGYLQALAQRHQDTVALFVGLGGGWWNQPRPAAKKEAP